MSANSTAANATAKAAANVRKRLDGLLTLAARTPYSGERRNALAAARRLVERFGLQSELRPEPRSRRSGWGLEDCLLTQGALLAAKQARAQALAAARARGLDPPAASLPRSSARSPVWRRRWSGKRQVPWVLARTLLIETRLSLGEIAEITGLSVYRVTALKLRLRPLAARPAAATSDQRPAATAQAPKHRAKSPENH